MSVDQEIIKIFKEQNINFAVSLPCKLLDGLIRILYKDDFFIHIPVTREEEGIGICSGATLTGNLPVLLIQSSGIGNCVNAFASLALYYNIPILILISHRGTEGETINAQIPMGIITPKILDVLGIDYISIEDSKEVGKIRVMIQKAKETEKPVAVLLPFSFWREGN